MLARMPTVVESVAGTGSDMPACALDSFAATRRVMMAR